jgi:hypothetical protein
LVAPGGLFAGPGLAAGTVFLLLFLIKQPLVDPD